MPVTERDRRDALNLLRRALLDGRNPDGAWGYYAGKSSRLEPTCWALLALGSGEESRELRTGAAAWLQARQQPSGALVEHPEWPVNVAFNALAAFTFVHDRSLFDNGALQRLLVFLETSKGAPAPPTPNLRQDNSLRGWPWIDATFSWVEPTCWGMLALKKARTSGLSGAGAIARISEAERLLLDRQCKSGGWNFGNAVVMGQDLRAYGPTTALGLLALQDHADQDAIAHALAALDTLWHEEVSATVLALALIAMSVHRRPTEAIATRLITHAEPARAFGNLHGLAMALFALAFSNQRNAFGL